MLCRAFYLYSISATTDLHSFLSRFLLFYLSRSVQSPCPRSTSQRCFTPSRRSSTRFVSTHRHIRESTSPKLPGRHSHWRGHQEGPGARTRYVDLLCLPGPGQERNCGCREVSSILKTDESLCLLSIYSIPSVHHTPLTNFQLDTRTKQQSRLMSRLPTSENSRPRCQV